MPKKPSGQGSITKADLMNFLKVISTRFDLLEEKSDKNMGRLDKVDKNLEDFKQETRHNFREQGQKADETNRRLGIIERSLEPLNKRVRYQKDMPERLEKVEGDVYDLKLEVHRLKQRG